MNLLFLISSGLVFISEYFLPAARYSYTNVIWLLPLSLIIINYNPLSSMLHKPIIFLFLGLFFSISIPFAPGGSMAGDAAILGDILIEADLRGVSSHGLIRLSSYYTLRDVPKNAPLFAYCVM